jgi:site-specific recombinase XerC
MESDRQSQALVPAESGTLKSVAGCGGMLVPRVIAEAGDQAARRFLEFFAATIRNKNTRQAYYHATVRFFAWVDRHKIGEIADIEPLHVAAYIEAMQNGFEKPSVKQHLVAIRMLFDWLVTGQVVATNPMRSAVRSTSSRRARPRCSPENRPAISLTVSTRQPCSGCATGR